jgi:hypothetical protein
MAATTIIVLVTAALSVLGIVAFLAYLWYLSFHLASRTARVLALCYAGAATAFSALVIRLVVGWTLQYLNAGVGGDPGPVIVFAFFVAAAAACTPSIVGIVVLRVRRRHADWLPGAHK